MTDIQVFNGNKKQMLADYDIDLNFSIDCTTVEESVRMLLKAVGENPERDGLLRTPNRVARMYEELLSGYYTDPEKVINNALFDVEYQEMVLVTDIEFYSLCEHHMLPFVGHAHVGYIPNKKVVGLSKIPRIVDLFARRLQVQERMTAQIANFLMDALDPLGVGVVVEGAHMCAMMRGVKKHGSRMVTSHLLGAFESNEKTRSEFLGHVQRSLGKNLF
ncbi:MAG: GTP cyclohydrolase I FolE [Anaerolineae bacterium]